MLVHLVAARAQGPGQRGAHRIGLGDAGERALGAGVQGAQHALRAVGLAARAGLGEGQERAQRRRAVVMGVGDLLGADRADHRHAVARAAEDHVEALLAAALVDRTEVHEHAAVRSGRVADAQHDHVALVALHVFQVLDEQAVELVLVLAQVLAFQPRGEFRILRGERFQRRFDLALLGLGEGDHAQAQAAVAAQQFAHQRGDVARLGEIAAVRVHAVLDAVVAQRPLQQGVDAGDRGLLVGRAQVQRLLAARLQTAVGNGDQAAVVERGVGETDQGLVAAAVMPGQQGRRQVARGLVEQTVGVEVDRDALAVLLGDDAIVLVVAAGGEEAGRRQLHLVADHHHLRRAAQRRHRFLGRDLAGLVEDHHVEQVGAERQGVGHRQRAHQPDRLEIVDHQAGVAAGEFADRAIAHALAELVLQLAPAAGVALLEALAVGVELGRRQRGLPHPVQELAVQGRAHQRGIALQQLALGQRGALRGLGQGAGVETGQLGLFALQPGQRFVEHQRVELRRRQVQPLQGVGIGGAGAVHRAQRRQRIGQIFEVLAQIAGPFGEFAQAQRVRQVQRLRGEFAQSRQRGGVAAFALRAGARIGLSAQALVQAAQGRRSRRGLAPVLQGLQQRGECGRTQASAQGLFEVRAFPGRLLVRGLRLQHLDQARTHRVLTEVVAARHRAAQAPPRRLEPAQQRAFFAPGDRQRGLGVLLGKPHPPVHGVLAGLAAPAFEPFERVALLAQLRAGGRIGVEQRRMRGQAGVVEPARRLGQRGRVGQCSIHAEQAGRVLESRLERFDLGVAIGQQRLALRIGALVAEQARRQPRERMRGQPVVAMALAQQRLQGLARFAFALPQRVIGQALALAGTERRRRRQLDRAPQQRAHPLAQRLGHRGHGLFVALDPAELGGQRLVHAGARLGQGLVPVRLREPALVAIAQIVDEGLLVGLRIVDQAAQLVQAGLLEPVEHHVERGALLAHEQHALAAPGVVGDQVGDGLRFAGTRRALDDEAAAAAGQRDRGVLGGVAGDHVPLLVRRDRRRRLDLELARLDREDPVEADPLQAVARGSVFFGAVALLALARGPGRARVVVDQLGVVAHQRHLLVVEIGQGDLGQVEVPGIGVAAVVLQRIGGVLGLLGARAHVQWRRHRRGADRLAQRQRAGLHALAEQGQAERPVVLALVAEIRALRVGPAAPAAAPLVLLQALHRLAPDQLDRRPGLQAQFHAGLGGADLRGQVGVDRLDRDLVQVHAVRQLDVVQLAQVMAQRRIELGLAVLALDQVLVAHALLAHQFDRQPQQGRDEAMFGVFLEVVPAQEGDHQAQVAETEFGAIAAGFLGDAVQRRGQVGLVVEAQPAVQADRFAADHLGGEFAAPGAQLLGPDAAQLQHDRHAGDGQVDAGLGRAELQQAIAPRQVEQAVAQVRQHRDAARTTALRAGEYPFHVQSGRLVAIGLQAPHQPGQIGGAVVPVQGGHLDDDRGQHRVQARVDAEQVLAVRGEPVEVGGVVEIQAAGQAGEHLAELEDVADLVVVADRQLPAAIARQVHRALDRLRRIVLGVQVLGGAALRRVLGDAQLADDVEGRTRRRLHPAQTFEVQGRAPAFGQAQAQAGVGGMDDIVGGERGDPAVRMQLGDRAQQGQRQEQHVVGGQAGAALGCDHRAQAVAGVEGLAHDAGAGIGWVRGLAGGSGRILRGAHAEAS